MQVLPSSPETYPPVNCWAWGSDLLPHKVVRRFRRKAGQCYVTLSTPDSDRITLISEVMGWCTWEVATTHIYSAPFRLRGTDRVYRLLGLFDQHFRVDNQDVFDTWARLQSPDGSIAYWPIQLLEHCDLSVLPHPSLSTPSQELAA